MNSPEIKRFSPPWIFGITNIPFGVAGTYSGVAVPFLLRKAGIPVEQIATISALSMLPAAYQLLWAPVIDLGIRRRSWLILCAVLGSICLSATLFIELPRHLIQYQIALVLGHGLVGMVASCNGALVSTTVDPLKRGKAAGFVNAANLGAATIGGGLVLTLANTVSKPAAAAALFLSICLPALAALSIHEPPPAREPLFQHLRNMLHEVWRAIRSKRGWTGLLFCFSPVGTVALTNLLSGIGTDYRCSRELIELVNGYAGGFITAAGALASGFILDRSDRRKLYLISGILTSACASLMALAPVSPATYVIGTTIYLLIAGLAYASFSAVVYEIVGTAGKTASTLYSIFPAAGNQAIAYTIFLDGQSNRQFGPRGLLWTDAILNLGGVLALALFLPALFPDTKHSKNQEKEAEKNYRESESQI